MKSVLSLGKYYLVDSRYPNRKGFLCPYKGETFHLSEFRQRADPRNTKEKFNFYHSSLRNFIERSFYVLKMKWRILGQLSNYSERKQTQIIIACMALHNFIQESTLENELFDKCDDDEDFVPSVDEQLSPQPFTAGIEEGDMNAFRDSIADALVALVAMGE
jgi:hypothetical protein